MRSTYDPSREYHPVKLTGNPKSRPWSVAIVSEGEIIGHAGEFSSKAEAVAYSIALATGRG